MKITILCDPSKMAEASQEAQNQSTTRSIVFPLYRLHKKRQR